MKKIPFLILEVCIVFSLISIIVYFGINKYNNLFNDLPKYEVKFNDIDGLDIGSPVRLAGVRIGHVVKQELKDNGVIITFKVINKNVAIPKNSTAGIEFFGLGGTKSLEIQPPQEDGAPDSPLLKPVNPLRFNSLMEMVNTLAEVTLDFSRSLFYFLDENAQDFGTIIKNAPFYLQQKSYELEKTGETIEEKSEQTIERTKEIKELVKETSDNLENVRKTLSNLATEEEIKNGIDQLKVTTENLADMIENGDAKKKIGTINDKIIVFNKKARELNKKIGKIKNREVGYLREFSDSLKKTADKMQKLIDSLEKRSNSSK